MSKGDTEMQKNIVIGAVLALGRQPGFRVCPRRLDRDPRRRRGRRRGGQAESLGAARIELQPQALDPAACRRRSSGSVTQVNGDSLAAGFTNQFYFYTDKSDGAMVMMDPTRAGPPRARSTRAPSCARRRSGRTSGTNRLNATLTVVQVPKTTAVAQIFQGTGPSKPLCELQVTSAGKVQLSARGHQPGRPIAYLPDRARDDRPVLHLRDEPVGHQGGRRR